MLILEILKWIGIVLLVLLLILLCVLLLVLFLPIKYYGEGTYNDKQQYVLFKVRWFFGLVRVKATFPQKPYLSVKILWMELLKPKKEAQESGEAFAENGFVQEAQDGILPSEKASEESAGAKLTPEDKNTTQESSFTSGEYQSVPEDEVKEKEPILNKVLGIKEKIKYYIGVVNEPETKEVIAHCKSRLLKVLKSICPRKIRFRGTVGFATPDTTGYLYGGYCMISSYLGKDVILIPDFEQEIVDVTGSIKGRTNVFVLGWNALRIYLDKRLMRLIRKLKKGGR